MLRVCADLLSIHIHSTHIAHFTNITSPLTLCHFLYIYPPLTLSHLLYALLYAPAALTLSHLSPLLLNAHLTLCHLFYSLYPPLFFCPLYTPGNHTRFDAFYSQNNTTLLALIGVDHTEDIAAILQVF